MPPPPTHTHNSNSSLQPTTEAPSTLVRASRLIPSARGAFLGRLEHLRNSASHDFTCSWRCFRTCLSLQRTSSRRAIAKPQEARDCPALARKASKTARVRLASACATMLLKREECEPLLPFKQSYKQVPSRSPAVPRSRTPSADDGKRFFPFPCRCKGLLFEMGLHDLARRVPSQWLRSHFGTPVHASQS